MSINTIDLKPSDSTNFDVRNWKIKLEKTKRKNRVKVSFKLDKEESEGFESFMGAVKPDDVSKEDFVRIIFFKGVETLNSEFSKIAREFADQKAKELAASGISSEETADAANEVLSATSEEVSEETIVSTRELSSSDSVDESKEATT